MVYAQQNAQSGPSLVLRPRQLEVSRFSSMLFLGVRGIAVGLCRVEYGELYQKTNEGPFFGTAEIYARLHLT
jgi:hypothetical protein